MLSCLGKLLIVVSLVFQAYVLYENANVSADFNSKLLAALQACKCIPDHIAGHILQFGRFVVVGLLASSALMLVSRCWFFKLLVLLGLGLQLYIQHQPFTKVPCIGCVRLWEKVAILGAIIYLMGADCAAKSCKTVCGGSKPAQPAQPEKVQKKSNKDE